METLNTEITDQNIGFSSNLINTKNRFSPINLELKTNPNKEELKQAKQLLAESSNIKPKSLASNPVVLSLNSSDNFLYDGYDSYAQHLIVKDLSINKVVAYVRIIETKIACDIGGYFCEMQFDLKNLDFTTFSAMELSHIAIDQNYSSENCIELLWSGLNQYADERNIDNIFGAISLNIENSHYPATREINKLKSKYLSYPIQNSFSIPAYLNKME